MVRRAVVVQDIQPFRDLIRMVLKSLGANEITLATNGREAMDSIRHKGADIIVIDEEMAELDGFECARQIRGGSNGIDPQTRIILLAKVAGNKFENAAYEAGVDHCLERPFTFQRLHQGISKALGCGQS